MFMDNKSLVLIAAKACDDKKARDIKLIKIDKVSFISEWILIAEGLSDVQVRSITNSVEGELREKAKIEPIRKEGINEAKWALLDYGDLIVNIFQPEIRKYYDLESFWSNGDNLLFPYFYFMNQSKCPVPREQQPTNEFLELSKSKIFSWPKTKKSLILILIKFWVGAFVLFLVISSGSVYFKTSLLKYILLSFFSSLSIPLLISIRLYLGWNHIFNRLISEKVEYEESGWYDGQVWEKPLVLKEKESLIASIEVKPILKNLIQIFSIISVLALSGILIFQYNNF